MSSFSLRLNKSSIWSNRRCLTICGFVALAHTQYGIDTAAIGGLQAMPGFLKVFGYEDPNLPGGYGIDSTVQRLMTSLMNLGSFVSSLAAGLFAAYFGRRHGLWAACVLNAIGVAVQLGATSAGQLYVGRLFLGFANGFLVTFASVYTAEAAPAHLRGITVAFFAYFVNIGSIIGSLMVNYTKQHMSKLSYQIPLACLYVVPTILAVGLFFVQESPRWLLHYGEREAARRALETLRNSNGDELEFEWAEMIRGVEEERRIAKATPFFDMFKGHDLRRTLLCYGMVAAQTASGIWFFIAYQTYFFSLAGITKAFEFAIMNPCIGLIAVNFGMYLLRRVGRRTIIIWGAITCGFCMLACGIAASVGASVQETGKVFVAFTALFMFFYDCGVGVASYPIATELVSSRLRAWTVGSANALGYFLAWLTAFCTPYFINPQDLNWGPKYTYIWAGSNFLCVVFFYFFVPEMKDRSLEELDEIFEAGVPAKKFAAYQCQIVEDAKQDVLARSRVDVVHKGSSRAG